MQSTSAPSPSALTPRYAVLGMLFLTAALFSIAVSLLPAPASAASGASSDWLFDHSYYTNKPKSGKRVWQYAPDPTPFRDPYAVLDSDNSSYPFEPGGYGPYAYPYYYNSYYSPMMNPGSTWGTDWFYGWNVNNYYPYDGRPINTD